jgi:DNA ligase-1
MEDGTIKIYSRNLENNSTKYPDLLPVLKEAWGEDTKSCIIDCEVVAWYARSAPFGLLASCCSLSLWAARLLMCRDKKEQKILPFQALSHRKRKNVSTEEVTVQVCLFAFDLIFRNGKSFLRESFAVRRKELRDHFKTIEGKFQFAKSMDTYATTPMLATCSLCLQH